MSWQAASFAVLGLVLAAGFAWYERTKPSAKVLSLVAALAALAVVGRLAFAAIPNVKPTTDIVLFAGFALGAAPGFAVGAVTAIVSNIFLSQGPWTAWQMVAWGGVGVGGALLARAWRGREPGRVPLALCCGVAGLAFGAFMDVYQWTLASRQDLASYAAVSGTSLPYNLAHAIGNVVFCLLIGPAFVRALRRYRRRFEVNWPAPARAALLGAITLAVALGVAQSAGAASTSARAVRFLERAQNRDGGFGAAPGQSSSQLYTGWAALGLAAAGHNPRDVHRRGGRTITVFVRRGARELRDIGEVERTIIVLRAAGLSPRRFRGRNLVAEVARRRRPDGSFAGYVSYTAFGILALRAAGGPVPPASGDWLTRVQNADGGFGLAPRVESDTDVTGATLQALVAAGRRGGESVRRAARRLVRVQNHDGGFGVTSGRSSNAQSTAYAVQGLVAARAGAAAVRRALRYLQGLQRRDGSIRYSRSSRQTPVWVTAQALAALRRKPFPLAPVARKGHAGRRAAGVGVAASPAARRGRSGASARNAATPAPDENRAAPDRRDPRGLTLDQASSRHVPPAATTSGGDDAPLLLLAGAGVATLLLLAAARHRLRRRATPGSG